MMTPPKRTRKGSDIAWGIFFLSQSLLWLFLAYRAYAKQAVLPSGQKFPWMSAAQVFIVGVLFGVMAIWSLIVWLRSEKV